MQIQRNITVDATPDRVWEVLALRFGDVHEWASSVFHSSESQGKPSIPGAPSAGRTCETELGPFEESIVEFDEAKKTLAYTASGEKMPFFVKGLRNRWALSARADGKTQVDMLMNADLAFPFNLFMAPLMKVQMGRVLTFAVEELKHFAETGRPHPRKLEADRKLALEAA